MVSELKHDKIITFQWKVMKIVLVCWLVADSNSAKKKFAPLIEKVYYVQINTFSSYCTSYKILTKILTEGTEIILRIILILTRIKLMFLS